MEMEGVHLDNDQKHSSRLLALGIAAAELEHWTVHTRRRLTGEKAGEAYHECRGPRGKLCRSLVEGKEHPDATPAKRARLSGPGQDAAVNAGGDVTAENKAGCHCG
ncbi:hypothetical protein WJX72_005667 [[Myrmecia] bisecta]|uniref:Uncharacterized protein n=1 Tax=[Myrmecia] bisecta TaxID=41462 RepID=A0AAW1PGS4_9CHLO